MRRATDTPDPHTLDDEALATLARTDPAAFAALYERHHATIHHFMVRRVSDSLRAEDLTSQVFLQALRGLPKYRSDSFRGWLFQIARNLIVDSYRRPSPGMSGDAVNWLTDPKPGPSEIVEAQEVRQEVQRLIHQLPGAQRQIIALRLQGYTGQEIADSLGVSLATVKSAQFRAFNKLRRLMSQDSDQE